MSVIFRPNRLTDYSDESILAEVERVISQHYDGNVPSRAKFDVVARVNSNTVVERFGSWAAAVRRAGFKFSDPREARVSPEQMFAELLRIKELVQGKYFSRPFFDANSALCTAQSIEKRFRMRWRLMLEDRLSLMPPQRPTLVARAVDQRKTQKCSDDQLFSELERVWQELGRRPSHAEFTERSKISIRVYEVRFGGWRRAVEWFFSRTNFSVVGLPKSHATEKILLAELQRIARTANDDVLGFRKYRRLGGTYSIGAFQAHFGSWKKALQLAGFRDGQSGRYSAEELFSEIQRLWESAGRQPTWWEMKERGAISCGVFKRRFGSWMKAIHAFCDDRQAADVPVREGCGEAANKSDSQREPGDQAATSRATDEIAVPSLESQTNVVLVDSRRLPGKRLRFRVFQRDGFRCVMCGRSPSTHPGVILHPDHKIPWSRGGLTVLENLQTACEDCNLGKSDFMPEATNI